MRVIKKVNDVKLNTLTRKTARTMREMTADKRNKQLNNGRKFFRLCLVKMFLLSTMFSANVFAAGPPGLTMTTPVDLETINSVPYSVTGTCTDNSGTGISSVTFDDGSGAVSVDSGTSSTISHSWNPADGPYTVTLACTDNCTGGGGCPKTTTVVANVTVSTAVGGPDVLSVAANTPVASSVTAGNTDVQMQYLQVGCTAGGGDDGNCVMTTVTLNDQGNAGAAGMIDNVYVHIDNDNNFGNGTTDSTLVNSWGGTSTGIDISGLTGNTIADGGTAYIWIVYDINSAADGQTIQSQVTDIAVSGSDTGASGTWNSNGPITITATGGAADCELCHTYPPGDGARALATGNVVGDHGPHVTTFGMACDDCHVPSGAYAKNHRNLNIEMKAAIEGGWYDRDRDGNNESGTTDGTFAQVKNPPATLGNCNTTNCHGTGGGPIWGTDAKVGAGCTLCHNNGTDDGAATNAYPSSTFRSADAVGLHDFHLTASNYSALTSMTIACADCHVVPGSIAAAGHIDTAADRANDADPTFPAGSKALLGGFSATYTNASQTCSVYCHSGTADDLASSTPAWSDTYGTCSSPANGCHGLPPNPAGATHTGYSFPADCNGCHGHVNTSGVITDTSLHINGTVEGGSCVGCHVVGNSQGAPEVEDGTSGHMVRGRGAGFNTFNKCEDCHPGGTKGGVHNIIKGGSADPGVVIVPNNATVGINYGHDLDSVTGGVQGGFVLGGDATTGSTEAEICWNCHNNATYGNTGANVISEWGTNTHANTGNVTYDYGSLNQPGWVGATWTSANFTYKTAGIQSTHSANSVDNTTNAAGLDTVAEIRCSFCHDVHDLNTATGDTLTGSPFLRGTWMGNPYKEDGAPQSGATYTAQNGFGAVPRAGTSATQEMGGYWIDQNTSNDPVERSWTANSSSGLCELCHGSGDATWTATEINTLNQHGTAANAWVGSNGHANAVLGGDGTGRANIFRPGDRNNGFVTAGDRTNTDRPLMGYLNINLGTANISEARGGFRSKDSGAWGWGSNFSVGIARYAPGDVSGGAPNNVWNVDIFTDNATAELQYHQFSCSKCHNPHASRLPRLMITNCLDTKHNTWDDSLGTATGVNANGDATLDATDASNNVTISNLTSAQNCHRIGDPAQGGTGTGWNYVTPWTDADGNYSGTGDQTQDNSIP